MKKAKNKSKPNKQKSKRRPMDPLSQALFPVRGLIFGDRLGNSKKKPRKGRDFVLAW